MKQILAFLRLALAQQGGTHYNMAVLGALQVQRVAALALRVPQVPLALQEQQEQLQL